MAQLIAFFELKPTFHADHRWMVDLQPEGGLVVGECHGAAAQWRLDAAALAGFPASDPAGWPPDDGGLPQGRDGIGVCWNVQTERGVVARSNWRPGDEAIPAVDALLRWCWHGLYEHAPAPYQKHLEDVFGYFHGWGVPALPTARGLKLFGTLTADDHAGLARLFDAIEAEARPVIDATNVAWVAGALVPRVAGLHQRRPGATWLANDRVAQQLMAAGIPKAAIEVVPSMT